MIMSETTRFAPGGTGARRLVLRAWWMRALGLVLFAGVLVPGIGSLFGSSALRAQVPADGAALPPPPELAVKQRYNINLSMVNYFYFTKDRGAVLFFSGSSPLVLTEGDAGEMQQFSAAAYPAGARVPKKVGRYYVNYDISNYIENRPDGSIVLNYPNCQALTLTVSESQSLRQVIAQDQAATQGAAPEVPGALPAAPAAPSAPAAPLAPAPAPPPGG
jgi:hypothetical protein